MVRPTITIPTGYEVDEQRAKTKRELARLMLEKGMQTIPMQSWLQVLGQMGTTAAGYHLNDQADKMEAATNKHILSDYTSQSAAFQEDAKHLKPDEMVAKYSGDPLLADDLKPYMEAMTSGLKESGEHIYGPKGWTTKGAIPEGSFEASKPTDSVIRDANGNWAINPVRTAAALEAQNFSIGKKNPLTAEVMADPTKAGSAPTPAVRAPVTPPPPNATGSDGLDLSLLSPDERQIMQRELQRRAASGGAFTPPNSHVPMGNPLTAQRPPAGVVDGKPYWLINGVPYDNPEGK